MNPTTSTLIVAMLTWSATAGAQPAASRGQPPGDGAINLRTLIEQVADDIDREIIVDSRIAGLNGITTSDDMDYETLLGILRLADLVAIETADQILITSSINSRAMPTRLLQEDDRRVSDHEIVTRVIQIPEIQLSTGPAPAADAQNPPPARTLQATQLVPVLRPMMDQSAQLGSVPGTNALILVDRYDNVRRITAVLEEIIDGLED